MPRIGFTRRRIGGVLAAVAVMVAGGVGLAVASTTNGMPVPNGGRHGHGINEFGMTRAYLSGHTERFTYTHGFYCDTTVRSTATSNCEGGANFHKPPAKQYDPLYITVPLGFARAPMSMDCPSKLICVDHPGTIDLRRLEPALKALYPQLSDKQLTKALSNYPVPGHDHFITTANNGKPEWWDVKIIGVTSPVVYRHIIEHRAYGYIRHLLTSDNKNVVGPIPTNLFLYFAVH